jgi:hypothetical protein
MTHKRTFNIYNTIKRGITHGWSVPLSSDGYANYGTGNVLTSDNSGPNGFANPNAWCVLSKVFNNQTYQFCIQTDGYMGLRLKYSKLGFGNGIDNLGSSPSATDQEILLGAGTDLAPNYVQITGGGINFNINNVFINLSTSTNTYNFILNPKTATIKPVVIKPKPIINKILT